MNTFGSLLNTSSFSPELFHRLAFLHFLRKLACQVAFIIIASKVIFRKNATRARPQANPCNNSGEGAKEHEKKYLKNDENSFMFRHQSEFHNNEPPDWSFKVVKTFKDPLSRQIGEAMLIKNHQGILLNSKAEFHQPPIVKIRHEIVTGLDE